jgi:hypothetical protein
VSDGKSDTTAEEREALEMMQRAERLLGGLRRGYTSWSLVRQAIAAFEKEVVEDQP